jgi:molybdate transport system regulatory protein
MRSKKRTLRYSFRLYLLSDGKRVLGKGGAQILDAIDRLGSITATSDELKMSYRFVWTYIRRMEDRLGKPVIVTRRGGTRRVKRKGGGGAELTTTAKNLLNDYRVMEKRLEKEISSRRLKLILQKP